MDGKSCLIDGDLVALRPAARMEDTLQAFAIRAACFIGEQDRAFFEEFDGRDHDATHLIAYLGDEPIGTVRLRWFRSFTTPDRLAVIQRAGPPDRNRGRSRRFHAIRGRYDRYIAGRLNA